MQPAETSAHDRRHERKRSQSTEEPTTDETQQLLQKLLQETGTDLKPLSPTEGIERYLESRRADLTENTLKEYRSKLSEFDKFCEEEGIEDLSTIDGRTIDKYESWRRYESSDHVDELSQKTMRDEMYLLRDYISYLSKIDAVHPRLTKVIDIPALADGDGVRNIDLDPDRVQRILSYLRKYHYATLDHVVWLLPVRTGRREGGLIGIDVGDAELDSDNPHLEFVHRPPETRLKNGEKGEGHVAISQQVAQVIQDHIDHHRPNVFDGSGREPLLATPYGRISPTTFRRKIYKWSRPCQIGQSCPHPRTPEDCGAAQSIDVASRCPSSRSPHALRHGYLTEGIRNGVPIELLSGRCDVSPAVLESHYDETTEEERREIRREVLSEYAAENGGGYL